jgi:phospholipid/cholesterol/gamma-HCH transport system ATP-binding protein
MEPSIKVQNLYKTFEGNTVLEDVSLEFYPREKLCIIGPSGCGKTVLTKHFTGLLTPDDGKVYVFGQDIEQADEDQLDDIRKQIGYVFQGNALFASEIGHDVYGNVTLPLRNDPYDRPARNEEEIRRRAEDVLTAVGMGPEFFDRMPSELSGGQQKRVAVARAMIANPKLMIYDEPTTGLDPESAQTVSELIEELYRRNRNTTIVITHHKSLMQRMGRVIFLRDGRVYFDGPYDQFSQSDDPIIHNFLAEADAPRYRRAPALRRIA